jgi:hypothetical protein
MRQDGGVLSFTATNDVVLPPIVVRPLADVVLRVVDEEGAPVVGARRADEDLGIDDAIPPAGLLIRDRRVWDVGGVLSADGFVPRRWTVLRSDSTEESAEGRLIATMVLAHGESLVVPLEPGDAEELQAGFCQLGDGTWVHCERNGAMLVCPCAASADLVLSWLDLPVGQSIRGGAQIPERLAAPAVAELCLTTALASLREVAVAPAGGPDQPFVAVSALPLAVGEPRCIPAPRESAVEIRWGEPQSGVTSITLASERVSLVLPTGGARLDAEPPLP